MEWYEAILEMLIVTVRIEQVTEVIKMSETKEATIVTTVHRQAAVWRTEI